ncbi:hypothetical protein AVEN_33927-1 [Araneus ventricosus]|uniref:Uncharacterized protein n=1 Tax=Araneus ventricosus TaxID=182803 RepID=A0A4Y2MYZ0_ARAVE|nr:hypothetical protein AVEN_33927-1 [Araneus ventricosus]
MWSNVQVSDGCPAPSSRSKHAMCVSPTGSIYLLGGRSANLPLKDLWRFDPEKACEVCNAQEYGRGYVPKEIQTRRKQSVYKLTHTQDTVLEL